MPAAPDLRASGDRIERLLDELQAAADPGTYDRAAEVLRLVVELYGAGLARMVHLVDEQAPALVDVFASDELIASLLVVHGLHPEALSRRVEAALAGVRPLLAAHAGDVELLAIDEEAGVVQLRLIGSCDGCPSSSITLQSAVERAIVEAAPEIVRLEVEQPSLPVPGVAVTIGTKPTFTDCPAGAASA
jgi:Fe-S cluster biogenesis protein NfuA